jgi:hypothetical protein
MARFRCHTCNQEGLFEYKAGLFAISAPETN